MNIDFWFDPACPWCWLTSRWLNDRVAPERGLEINWRPISLLFKNKMDDSNPFFEKATVTHGFLRVFLAIKEELGNEVASSFYTEAGTAIHNNGNTTVTATELLEAAGIDTKYNAAFYDEKYDAHILSEMDAGLDLVGDDVGTPIIAFDSPSGEKGIFGPVISKIPDDTEESLELWDAIIKISSMDHFWELKRTRTQEPDFNY